MCGIFGYAGKKHDATEVVFEGLRRLDYRGYDSWGIGIMDKNSIKVNKYAGKINGELMRLPSSTMAIGHTRWATHGAVNDKNAHPHFATDKAFILAHNGIAENYLKLKKKLRKKKHLFKTDTDTEVIVRLIEDKLRKERGLASAVRKAFLELEGRNTIIVLSKDGQMIGVRNGSPLVVGADKESSEIYFSSDALSLAPFVKKLLVLDNNQLASYKEKRLKLIDVKTEATLSYRFKKIDIKAAKIDKEGYKHFMIKEIQEAAYVISRVAKQSSENYLKFAKAIKKAKDVYTIGSGTAGAAAAQIAFYLKTFGKIRAVSLIGAEASDYYSLFQEGDLIIAPSQSGETADVLEVLELASQKGVTIASFVNMPGSMITRISDYKFMAQAGPEICVVSTKIFVAKLAWGYLISKAVQGKLKEGLKNLNKLASTVKKYLKNKSNHAKIRRLAKKLAREEHIFLLGKSQNLQIVKEGMVKIIECAYIHAHAIPAGDLKHYAITLMEEGVPVICVISNDGVKKDVLNAVSEVKARGAQVIGISSEKISSLDFHLPVPDTGETSAIMNVIPLQLLAYYMGVELGNDVDKPRNIAKSVTVK